MMLRSLRLPLLVATLLAPLWTGAATLKINGSTTVNLPVAEAAEMLRAEQKLDIQVDTQGGSSGGISALGDGLVQIGMASKHLSDADRAKYPKVSFKEIHIGEDAVALVVSRDVWESGLRALTKEQVRDIYEGRVKNWKQVGGPDRRIAFFNKEPGRGTWEVFAHWLYGDPKKAPQVSLPEVGGMKRRATKSHRRKARCRNFHHRGRTAKPSSRSRSKARPVKPSSQRPRTLPRTSIR